MPTNKAELFERANVVDIGLQRNEVELKQRLLEKPFDSLNLETSSTNENPPSGMRNTLSDDDNMMEPLNIDEVDDSPRSPHLSGNVTNAPIDSQIDDNLIVDEAFQQSLHERASQFSSNDGSSINTNTFPSMPKPKVEYAYSDKTDIHRAIDEWFTPKEVRDLHSFRQTFENRFDSYGFNSQGTDEKEIIIEQLIYELNTRSYESALSCLFFITLGAYEDDQFVSEDHIHNIRRNTLFVIRSNALPAMLALMDTTFDSCKIAKTGLVAASRSLFQLCTILYIVVLIHSGMEIDDIESENLKLFFHENHLLTKLTEYIDSWRWSPKPSMRIRNIIILFASLLQFEFGDLSQRRHVKTSICLHLGLDSQTLDEDGLSASPVDFYTFRQDIIARYPAYTPPPSKVPIDFDDSLSLLQFISSTRPTSMSSYPNTTSYPPPTVHISTPAPSPSPPPNLINKPVKGKRSFQTNVNYPLIYPSESITDGAPKSIKEASELFASRVKAKLSLSQLWNERDIFVKQERGWSGSREEFIDLFDYSGIESTDAGVLNRVHSFYKDSLRNFSSLVHVVVQLIASSGSSFDALLNDSPPDLDVIRVKEILLKNAVYSLVLLLKWFKTSHILKFEYLSTLLYDYGYISATMNYLKALDVKLLERIEFTDLYNYKNSIFAGELNATVDKTFCFTLINLLKITSLISKKKTQRILNLTESDPASTFRNLLSIYNPSLWSPVLELVKEITPFNGKKWKASNMDLISMVYLHSKVALKENWLTGKAVESEISDAYGQEIALRALIQFYNMRNCPESMVKMGYENRERDYFARSVDLSSHDK